jgi:hypothetical protein
MFAGSRVGYITHNPAFGLHQNIKGILEEHGY